MKEGTAQTNDMHTGHSGNGHVRVPQGEEGWPDDFIYDDGVPLDTPQHRHQMNLLADLIDVAMAAQGRDDYYVGGNMFIYYSREQARFVAENPPPAYRHVTGPDVFFVDGVDPKKQRPAWIVWKEDQRYPDLIVELLSPSTQHIDRGVKKQRYAELFHTPEYYLYEPASDAFEAFRLGPGDIYLPAPHNEQGWVWSDVLGAWLGLWQGTHKRTDSTWLRLYDAGGHLLPTEHERAETERQRAETERQRAEAAEAEMARLRALLAARDDRDE